MFSIEQCKLHRGATTTKEARNQQRALIPQPGYLVHIRLQFFLLKYNYIITALVMLLLRFIRNIFADTVIDY